MTGRPSTTPDPRDREENTVAQQPQQSTTSTPVELTVKPRPGQLTFAAPRRGKPPRHLADFDMAGRREFLAELGHQPFRAGQLSRHYFDRFATAPEDMTDLPAAGREELVSQALPTLLTTVRSLEADQGDTVKNVHRCFDGTTVESVLMRYTHRVTMCISSQAGCGMNCPFCATGQAGLTRNLSTAEMVEQVVQGARMLRGGRVGRAEQEPLRISNIVFMGMGEALANYKASIGAIHRLIDPSPEGLGISARGITMSTVGLVPGIRKFTQEKLPVTLALSLHAPDDELRDELIPINTRWKVDEALDAAYDYYQATGRRVSIEYALIRDINDHLEPGVGLSGMGFTCTHPPPRALSFSPSRSARHPWSLMSRMRAYSMETRRPDLSA